MEFPPIRMVLGGWFYLRGAVALFLVCGCCVGFDSVGLFTGSSLLLLVLYDLFFMTCMCSHFQRKIE